MSIIHIPGVIPIHLLDIPSFFQPGSDTVTARVVVRCLERDKEVDWIVTNSLEGIEGIVVEAMLEKLHIYCVGPLLPSAYLDRSDPRDVVVETSSQVEMDCTKWLDEKPPKSVIYVSLEF